MLFAFLCLFFFSSPAFSQNDPNDFSWHSQYTNAIPAFWQAAETAVKGYDHQEETAQWALATSQRLPEFLDDMISVCATIEKQPFPGADISAANQFVAKWNDVFATCPNCQEIVPLVKPVVDQLFAGLPALPEQQPDELSTQYLYRVYKFLQRLNPWNLGSLFSLEPVAIEKHTLTIHEDSQEERIDGIRRTFVEDRRVLDRRGIRVKFLETIHNDKVMQVSVDPEPVTFLHEALDAIASQGGDPQLIKQLKDLTGYMDARLKEAWKQGSLDSFSYYYLYDQRPITNEMVHVTSPLFLLPPYYNEYKVREFYPRHFMDDQWGNMAEAQQWAQREKYLMAQENSQAIIGPAAAPAASVGPASISPSTNSAAAAKPANTTATPPGTFPLWSSLLVPLYLFILVGIGSKFFGF